MAAPSKEVIKATRVAGGKRLAKLQATVDRNKSYGIDEAVKLVKSNAKAKFDETVEIAMNLGVDPRHADQMVRGVCNLPHGSGRTQRVAVFARGPKAEEAKAAGADIVGAEDLVEQVSKGVINFDRCIATPDMMGLVGRLGKVLGPRGLMPNPRVGTVTMDVKAAVEGAKGGAVEFRVEKSGIIHAGVVGHDNHARVLEHVVERRDELLLGSSIHLATLSIVRPHPCGRGRGLHLAAGSRGHFGP